MLNRRCLEEQDLQQKPVLSDASNVLMSCGTQRANVRTMYVQARTYGFGTDNIRNESFLDVRVCTYNVRS